MEKKFKFLVITLAAIVLVLSSSLEAIRASSTIDEGKLPDFLLRYSEYRSQGNATRLAQIRNQMLEQEKINRERIESTKGAVLQFNPLKDSLLTSTNSMMDDPGYTICWMDEQEFTSPYETYGYVEDEYEMEGLEDYSYTHLHTDDWNYDYENPMGGEAFNAGKWYQNNGAFGDFWVYAKKGPHSTSEYSNYIIFHVCVGDPEDFDDWEYIGYRQVTTTFSLGYWMGFSSTVYDWVAVECWTPPQAPEYYEPLIKNCVYVDCTIAMMWGG